MAMTLRLSEDLDAQLASAASARHMSKQQMVVHAVEKFMREEAHAERTRRSVQRVIRENAELLDDLSRT